jgi:pimeloyl-ACP methyl ester carboxylesterase
MADLIVVLPGIGGSVLSDHRQRVYDPPLHTLWRMVRGRHEMLEALAGDDRLDDPDAPQPVRATGLVGMPVAVPGLGVITSYGSLRRRLTREFELTVGDPDGGGPPANYFEFAYDWRRDNRISAAALKRLVDRELPRWNATLPEGSAKVILLAHSMGGLVAKYYLDALRGWTGCRALVTFGTPFRGAPKALNLLANGFRKAGVELTALSEVLRRYTSVYQLLPRYPVVMDHSGPDLPTRPVRVTDLGRDVGGLDLRRAVAARTDFHELMDTDRSTHAGLRLDHLVSLVPIMGYGHPTTQSAVLDRHGRLRCTVEPARPDERNPWYTSGDGTVPVLSALPVELSESMDGQLENETHGTIHGRDAALTRLVHTLSRHGAGLADQQVPLPEPDAPRWEPALGLSVNEVFEDGEPVVVRCTIPAELAHLPGTIALDSGTPPPHVGTDRGDDTVTWTIEGLPAGGHTATVTVGDRTVHAAFEIA